jgi:hypothetical protein
MEISTFRSIMSIVRISHSPELLLIKNMGSMTVTVIHRLLIVVA